MKRQTILAAGAVLALAVAAAPVGAQTRRGATHRQGVVRTMVRPNPPQPAPESQPQRWGRYGWWSHPGPGYGYYGGFYPSYGYFPPYGFYGLPYDGYYGFPYSGYRDAYGLWGPSSGLRGYYRQTPPRVIYVPVPATPQQPDAAPTAPAREERGRGPGGGYYLEPPPPEMVDYGARQGDSFPGAYLSIEELDEGMAMVRWMGPPEGLKSVVFQVLDAKGEKLSEKTATAPPFRALIKYPDEAAAVQVKLTGLDGSEFTARVPRRKPGPPRPGGRGGSR